MNQSITPSVRIDAPMYCASSPAASTRTGRRLRSSHEMANMPGASGMPPHGSRMSSSGHDPSCTASLTAAAHAPGAGSPDSSTEFVMNQPTESCHAVSYRLCTGKTARSAVPASSRVTSVIAETARASVETASDLACAVNAALSSTSSTSRTSTRSGCGTCSPSGNGKSGIVPPLASRISRHRRWTSCGAFGRSRSAAECSANAGTSTRLDSRPPFASARAVSRSRTITSIDHMSTCEWSAAMTTVSPAAVSSTLSRWDGAA